MTGISPGIAITASAQYKKAPLFFAKLVERASSLLLILAPSFTGEASNLSWVLFI